MSNSLAPDQDRRSVGPDLGSNCLQWLSKHVGVRTVTSYVELDYLFAR